MEKSHAKENHRKFSVLLFYNVLIYKVVLGLKQINFLKEDRMKAKFLLSGLALAGSLTYAADFKLGYVDVAKIFTTSKPAVAMQANLKAKFLPGQQELQKMNEAIVKEQTDMQSIMKKAPSMDKLNSTDRANLEKMEVQYQKDQGNFQRKYMAFEQTAQRTQDYASALILGKVNTILKDISDKGNYDLILTSNQLVYVKPKYDLTDQVIEELNKVDGADLVKQLNDAEKQSQAGGAMAAKTPTLAAPKK